MTFCPNSDPEIREIDPEWGDFSALDPTDAVRRISGLYSFSAFAQLTFDQMLEVFDNAGTSSEKLFDTLLDHGLRCYCEQSPDEKTVLERLEETLSKRASDLLEKGDGPLTVNINLTRFHLALVHPLSELEKKFGTEQTAHAKNVFILEATRYLFLSLLNEELVQQENTAFKSALIQAPTLQERQFGYNGKRGSVVNSFLIYAKHSTQDHSASARKIIALLGLIRKVSKRTLGPSPFWLYTVDSKTYPLELQSR